MMPSIKFLEATPHLGEGEVHVWRAWLEIETTSVEVLARTLSADELDRAMRFRRSPDCHRFVAAHTFLRFILGYHLNLEPARIVFTRGRFGKPALGRWDEDGPLHFSLSYSHDLALCAVSRDFEVGIDVERIQPGLASMYLAEQFLPPEDVSRLRTLSRPQWTDAFFLAWTRMEARQKASGNGLVPMKTITTDCSFQPFEGGVSKASEKATLTAENLAIHSGYAAALAVDGYGYTARYSDCPASPFGGPPTAPVKVDSSMAAVKFIVSCRQQSLGEG